MKERLSRGMGYLIVLLVVAIYFVISYMNIDGFRTDPLVSIIDGVLISIGTIVSTMSMTQQGMINGRFSKRYQETLQQHLIQKQKIYPNLKKLQSWLDYDYFKLLKVNRMAFVNSAGYDYEEVFTDNGKVVNSFKLPKPEKFELKNKKLKIFYPVLWLHYFCSGDEWRVYRKKKKFIKKAKRYDITRLTTSDLININSSKDPNDFGKTEGDFMKKKGISTVATRLFISFGLPFIAFSYHTFGIEFFLTQLMAIIMMLISATMAMFNSYTFMITTHRNGIVNKINKLEEFERSDFNEEQLEELIETGNKQFENSKKLEEEILEDYEIIDLDGEVE